MSILDEVPVEISSVTRNVYSERLLFSWGPECGCVGGGTGGRGERVCFLHYNCSYIHLLVVFVTNISGDRFLLLFCRLAEDHRRITFPQALLIIVKNVLSKIVFLKRKKKKG